MILHTSIQGNGEPLLFLHTGLQTGNTDFQYQQDFFKDSYRVFAPDLRGHGHSVSHDIENFFLDSAQDLLETINHYELGSSFGRVFTRRNCGCTLCKTFSGEDSNDYCFGYHAS